MAARLIDSLWVASYGSQLASGSVYFYAPGTTTPVTVYSDDAATVVVTQPVSLDQNGRTTVPIYATSPMRAVLFDADGSQVTDIERIDGDRAELVALVNAWWPAVASENAAWTALGTSLGSLNGLVKVTGTGAVGRTVQAKLSEQRSVTDFGAVGTGIVDDFAAFTSGIAAVAAAGGGTLLIPPGTYLTSQTVVLLSGVSLRGASATASVIKNTAAAGACISATNLSNSVLEDFGITHSTSSTAQGVLLTGCKFFTLSRLTIDGHRFPIDSTDVAGVNDSRGHRYVGCRLTDDGNAAARPIRIDSNDVGGNSGSHLLFDNIVGSTAALSTGIEIRGSLRKVTVLSNRTSSSVATGILINSAYTGTGLIVMGNDFSAATTNGLNIAPVGAVSILDYANRWGPGITDASTHVGAVLASERFAGVATLPLGSYAYTQSIGATSAATIDLSRGNVSAITGTAGGITITIPAPANIGQYQGYEMKVMCINSSGGAVTWTFNGAYVTSGAVAPASGSRTTVTFVIVGSSAYETARQTV